MASPADNSTADVAVILANFHLLLDAKFELFILSGSGSLASSICGETGSKPAHPEGCAARAQVLGVERADLQVHEEEGAHHQQETAEVGVEVYDHE